MHLLTASILLLGYNEPVIVGLDNSLKCSVLISAPIATLSLCLVVL